MVVLMIWPNECVNGIFEKLYAFLAISNCKIICVKMFSFYVSSPLHYLCLFCDDRMTLVIREQMLVQMVVRMCRREETFKKIALGFFFKSLWIFFISCNFSNFWKFEF